MARRRPDETKNARKILKYTSQAKDSLIEACDESRVARRNTGGRTTTAEQDLLRAMLTFAAAGLDSLLKRLIRDTIRLLASHDEKVQEELEKFTLRKLKGESDDSDVPSGFKFLSKIISSQDLNETLIDEYITELTGSSLQSDKQLFKACNALGLEPNRVGLDRQDLKDIFKARNQIIHELDIQLMSGQGRRTRRRDTMLEYSEGLIEIGKFFIEEVERKILSFG